MPDHNTLAEEHVRRTPTGYVNQGMGDSRISLDNIFHDFLEPVKYWLITVYGSFINILQQTPRHVIPDYFRTQVWQTWNSTVDWFCAKWKLDFRHLNERVLLPTDEDVESKDRCKEWVCTGRERGWGFLEGGDKFLRFFPPPLRCSGNDKKLLQVFSMKENNLLERMTSCYFRQRL